MTAKLIAEKLYPRMARRVANVHNRECHGGTATALIIVDDENTPLRSVPYYKVVCEVCGGGDV